MTSATDFPPTHTPNLAHGAPLTRETLADRLTAQLRQQISAGALGPGDLMPTERELCERFGVGRTTVREALHGLIVIGALERRSGALYVRDAEDGSGPSPAVPTDDNLLRLASHVSVADVYETRKAIEGKAVEQAAAHRDRADIARMREALDRMRDATGDAFHDADVEFHFAVVNAAKNAVLLQVYEDSRTMFFRLPSVWRMLGGNPSPNALAGWDGHRQVADAIERRDGVGALRLTCDMLDGVSKRMTERLRRTDRLAGPAAG